MSMVIFLVGQRFGVHCWLVALLLVALGGGLLGAESALAAGRKYALVVGVSSYRPGQPLPKLPFTENDARDLAKVLSDGGYTVTLMTAANAKVDGNEVLAPVSDFIRDQLDVILTNPNLKSDDIVIVALAGHGVQYELLDGERKTPKFYFCPSDADISRLKTANEVTERHNLIDLAELYAALNVCKAGGKLLLVDACRNDPSKPTTTRSSSSLTLPALPPPPGGIAAFFSCSANQQAYEDSELKHGVFFHHVIEALKGDADAGTAKRPADGQISLAELSEHVSSETYGYVQQKYRAKQAPELKGEFRLSLSLLSVASQAAGSTKPMVTPPGNVPVVKVDVSPKPGELRVITVKGIETRWHWIPAGSFRMGSPPGEVGQDPVEVQKTVQISVGFWMLETEVTQELWTAVMGTTVDQQRSKTTLRTLHGVGAKYPIYFVNFADAVDFCRRFSGLLADDSAVDLVVRMPTEAEWEYAARAGTVTRHAWGHRDEDAGKYAWYSGNSKGTTQPVGQKLPNAWGLKDTAGNVFEWCAVGSPVISMDGATSVGDTITGGNVLRGGSWGYSASSPFLRPSGRLLGSGEARDMNFGFRVIGNSSNK